MAGRCPAWNCHSITRGGSGAASSDCITFPGKLTRLTARSNQICMRQRASMRLRRRA